MSRIQSALLVTLVWAGIYLPFLGSCELRSEEGRRVLPAVEMIDTGDYLVPHIGGQPYLRKPPLVNWLIAGSFKLFGTRNEITARLPSTLAVLAAALAFLFVGGRALGPAGAGIAALAWLTNLGVMEKGRMIEIDALYISLFAIAFVCWLAWWRDNRDGWRAWFVPWLVLGLGLLAKGPAHLVFFYPLVVAVLWKTRSLRDLARPAHFAGIAVMIAMFVAWAVPCFHAVQTDSISATWTRELAMRITGGENDATEWPMNFPRGLGYIIPWIVLLPFVRPSKMQSARERNIATGLAIGAGVPFVVTLLLPGTIPRYILPTLAPVCWLIGMAVRDNAFEWNVRLLPLRNRNAQIRHPEQNEGPPEPTTAPNPAWHVPPRYIWGFVIAFAIFAGLAFPFRSATFLHNRPKVTVIAAKMNALLPRGETLFAVNPLFQPYLFYMHTPVRYVNRIDELPADTHFFIALPTERAAAEQSERWAPARVRYVTTTAEYRGHATALFEVVRR